MLVKIALKDNPNIVSLWGVKNFTIEHKNGEAVGYSIEYKNIDRVKENFLLYLRIDNILAITTHRERDDKV